MAPLLEAQTKFQKIKIEPDATHPGEIILWLDSQWQLASWGEYRYHECLVTLPLACAPAINNILVCGGGDGMSLREAVRFPDCYSANLVEIDGGMIEIFRDMPQFAAYNSNSMRHEKAHVFVADAFAHARETSDRYDAIFLDLPSPGKRNWNKEYQKLFAPESIDLLLKRLMPQGVFAMQSSIQLGLLAKIVRHLFERRYYVWHYDSFYNAGGSHDSFIVAAPMKLTQERPIPPGCRFANKDRVRIAFSNFTELTQDALEYYTLFASDDHVEHELIQHERIF